MRTKTPPEPDLDIPDLEVPAPGAASGPPSSLAELEPSIERAPSFPPPDPARIAGEWAEYSEPGRSAGGSVPPPRTSGFVRARRLTSNVETGEFPFFAPARVPAVRPTHWGVALGPGVLLVATSVVMSFFDQRSFPLETLRAGELSSRPPTWIAALTCCLGVLSIALGARRLARGRVL